MQQQRTSILLVHHYRLQQKPLIPLPQDVSSYVTTKKSGLDKSDVSLGSEIFLAGIEVSFSLLCALY
jgi:hypothetical protein